MGAPGGADRPELPPDSVSIRLIVGRRRLLASRLLHRVVYILVEILPFQARQIRLRLFPVALKRLADASLIITLFVSVAHVASLGWDSPYLPQLQTSTANGQASPVSETPDVHRFNPSTIGDTYRAERRDSRSVSRRGLLYRGRIRGSVVMRAGRAGHVPVCRPNLLSRLHM